MIPNLTAIFGIVLNLLVITGINGLGSECVNMLNNELYDLGNLHNDTM